eukprot:jgi/Chlat1/2421/Chrsp17S02672
MAYNASYTDNGRDVVGIDLAIASTTALIDPRRQFILFQATVIRRTRGNGADVMRSLASSSGSQRVSVSLDLLAKGRVFATMRNVPRTQGPTIRRVTCALSPNSTYTSSLDILSDCRDLPMLPRDASGYNFMLAAYGNKLYAAVETTKNNGLDIPTIVRCPFESLSLTAPSCQRVTLPVPGPPDYFGWSFFVEGEQLYSSAVYKGRFFMIFAVDGPGYPPDYAQSRQAFIASCGGQQLECTLYKAPRNNTTLDADRFNGYHPTQLKVYDNGLYLWPADPSPAKLEITEFVPDVYNSVGQPDLRSRSRLFFSSILNKFIAGFSIVTGFRGSPVSYVLYTGLPCKTLPTGCRARNNNNNNNNITCEGLDYECGTGLDTCGRVVDCGNCEAKQPTPYTQLFCAGRNVPNRCGCIPEYSCSDVCTRTQHQCSSSAYPVRDTCGRDCDCGTCQSGFTCRKSVEEGDSRNRCYRTCNINAPQYGAPGSCNHDGRCRRDGSKSIFDNTCGPPLYDEQCFWVYNPNNTKIGCCMGFTSTRGVCELDCPDLDLDPPEPYYR